MVELNLNVILEEAEMKRLLLVISIVFIILTFMGAGFVLWNQGRVNAGYAVIPMVLSLVFLAAYRGKK